MRGCGLFEGMDEPGGGHYGGHVLPGALDVMDKQ